MSTAFVMTGGGSLGAVQVGMLDEVLRAGVRPDFIVGVSAGAINGALLAQDPSPAAAERLSELWMQTTTRQALGLSWRSALGLLGMRGEIGHSSGLRALLERALAQRRLEQLAVPLHVVCAEFATGEAVVLSTGELIEAVLASAAVPGIFAPVEIGGQLLVDGAVASESPIAVACRLGATKIIVFPCGFACAANTVSRRAIGRAMHAVTLLGSRQLRQDVDRYGPAAAIHLIPPLCPLSQLPYDYSQAREMIERSRQSTRSWLEGGGLHSHGVPHEMLPHQHRQAA